MNSDTNLILVINCGSSSLKFALYQVGETSPVLSGLAECLGQEGARLTCKSQGQANTLELGTDGHGAALDALVGILAERKLLSSVKAVGHRVVHGGERFKASALIDEKALTDIEACTPLAPLHNPANIQGIRTALAKLPGIAQVAVFDTAFHQTMPEAAYLYAVPYSYYRDHGVRRYGFHGTSHRYVAAEAVRLLGLDPNDHGLVIAHLGNGASATAVLNGKSVDTTMGLTPLEGLVMGTRSGDVDPGAVFHIARQSKLDIDGLDSLLNKKSGLLGLSELSNDCRVLEAAAKEGNAGAKRALDVFSHRLARYIGGLAMSLKRLDAVVFTGGIGENSATMRRMAIERLQPLGIVINDDANRNGGKENSGIISQGRSPAAVVVRTDEEWMIAHDTAELAGIRS